MKRYLLFIFIALALGQTSFAQGFILSGRVVDKNNKPVKKAIVQAVGAENMGFATTNDEGLYFTAEVPAGKYEVIIKIDSTTYLSKVDIAATDPKKRFYNFQVKGKKAELTISDKDVFMETALNKLRSRSNDNMDGRRQGTIKVRVKHQ